MLLLQQPECATLHNIDYSLHRLKCVSENILEEKKTMDRTVVHISSALPCSTVCFFQPPFSQYRHNMAVTSGSQCFPIAAKQ